MRGPGPATSHRALRHRRPRLGAVRNRPGPPQPRGVSATPPNAEIIDAYVATGRATRRGLRLHPRRPVRRPFRGRPIDVDAGNVIGLSAHRCCGPCGPIGVRDSPGNPGGEVTRSRAETRTRRVDPGRPRAPMAGVPQRRLAAPVCAATARPCTIQHEWVSARPPPPPKKSPAAPRPPPPPPSPPPYSKATARTMRLAALPVPRALPQPFAASYGFDPGKSWRAVRPPGPTVAGADHVERLNFRAARAPRSQ